MDRRKTLRERLSLLKDGEALNVTRTSENGDGIRKVKFNPRSSYSLVELPDHKGIVFNIRESFQGLDNFLRLEGYSKNGINKIHRELERIMSPRREHSLTRYRRDRDYSDGIFYLIIHLLDSKNFLFRNKYLTIYYDQGDGKYKIFRSGNTTVIGDPYKINQYLSGYSVVMMNFGNLFNFFDINGAFYQSQDEADELQRGSSSVSIVYNLASGPGNSFLYPGNALSPNQYLVSPNGKYKFWYQGDGNLVISGPNDYLVGVLPYGQYNPYNYTSGGGAPPAILVYDSGGQLIIYKEGTALWATGLQNNNNPYLILSDEGILGSYAGGSKIWTCPR